MRPAPTTANRPTVAGAGIYNFGDAPAYGSTYGQKGTIDFSDDVDASAVASVLRAHGVVAYADEPLRVVAYRMAEHELTRLPVISPEGATLGIIELSDLLTARSRVLEAEQRRERHLGTRVQLRAIAALFGGDRFDECDCFGRFVLIHRQERGTHGVSTE